MRGVIIANKERFLHCLYCMDEINNPYNIIKRTKVLHGITKICVAVQIVNHNQFTLCTDINSHMYVAIQIIA